MVVTSESSGGAARESTASIRFRAPLGYQAQNRAVTTEDYKTLLVKDYPDVESITVWGGEENDPPNYGTVYVSFKPTVGTTISEVTKRSIKNSLANDNSIVGINTEILDPEYIYVRVDSEINYNSANSSVDENALKQLVSNKIYEFGDEQLEKFDKGLRYSN